MRKLTGEQISIIKARKTAGERICDLAREHGVSCGRVSQLCGNQGRAFVRSEFHRRAPRPAVRDGYDPFTYHWVPSQCSAPQPNVIAGITLSQLMAGR